MAGKCCLFISESAAISARWPSGGRQSKRRHVGICRKNFLKGKIPQNEDLFGSFALTVGGDSIQKR